MKVLTLTIHLTDDPDAWAVVSDGLAIPLHGLVEAGAINDANDNGWYYTLDTEGN
jgi:hypothetical protein